MGNVSSVLSAASLALLCGAPSIGQEVLFFQSHNLLNVPPMHTSIGAAIRHLCAGPSAAEAAQGHVSHLPAGTQLLAVQQSGNFVRLVFDEQLLRAAPGRNLEDAIEQIDKTALQAAGIDRV